MGKMSVGLYALLIAVISLSVQCANKVAGSVTETGNVTGKVIVKTSNTPVAGARIALFKKQTSLVSPNEPIVPYRETYTDSRGDFSFEIDDGTYTMLASDDGVSAFIDNLVAGTTDSRGMTVALQNSGTIRGEITNSVETRQSGGSVVVRILGTDIFQKVDSIGRFTLDNVPAGELTLVSFSTALSDFYPDYRKITVIADTIMDINQYELHSNTIPIPDGVSVSYDSVGQVVTISWHPIGEYADFQEYGILRGIAGKADHALEQIGYTADTVYKDRLTFNSVNAIQYEYAVRLNNKFGQSGSYYGIYPVTTAPYQSAADAGADQRADIGSVVTLSGTITDPKRPIVKMEWKIGTATWVHSDSGEGTFTTGSSPLPETTLCIFRITDSLGNQLLDSLTVVKAMRVTDHGPLPSPVSGVAPCITRFNGKYWYVSGTTGDSYGIWSSSDLAVWKSENGKPGFANGGQLVACGDHLCLLNLNLTSDGNGQQITAKSYQSPNGIDWSELTVAPPPAASDSLITTWDSSGSTDSSVYDGYYLKSGILPFQGSLYAVISVTIFRGTSGQTLQCLVVSENGTSWRFVGRAPVGDYRFGYDLFARDNDLYFISHPAGLRYTEVRRFSMYRSSDKGSSWESAGFWGSDFPVSPDNVDFVAAADPAILVRFSEQQGDAGHEMYYYNNKWNTVPADIVGEQRYAGGIRAWAEANRFYWVDPDYHVKSIRLF